MRRFVMVFTAIFIMSLNGSVAVGEDRNELGLYCDPSDLSTTSIELSGNSYLDLYLVLTNPYFFGTGKKVESVPAFECRVETGGDDDLVAYMHDDRFINFGELPDLIVGFEFPCLVVEGQVVLGRVTIFHIRDTPAHYYLSPISIYPSIPEHMAFVAMDARDEPVLCPMYPISGGFENPVFAINGSVVPVESETWGGIKATYR